MSDTTDPRKNGLNVIIDARRCIANGKCAVAAPGIYVLDEETGIVLEGWEVKAIRWDRWTRQRGTPVEVEKVGADKGTLQNPELFTETSQN